MRSVLIFGVVMCALPLAGQEIQAETYALPDDPTEPVITLDYRGDRLTRIDEAPTLSIFADGRVVMPQSYAHTKAYQGQISPAELQGLLDFIIRDNRFFDYDAEAVRAKVEGQRRQPIPLHLSTTVIRVQADDRAQEIRYHALGRGPMVEETQRLLAVQQRLDQLMSVVKLGGKDRVDQWLELANRELGSKFSDAAPLRAEDLTSGGQRANGSIYVRFVRPDAASVTIDVDASGERHVTVAPAEL